MSAENTGKRCSYCERERELGSIEARLESLEKRVGESCRVQLRVAEKLDSLIPAVARLEVKAGVWGGVGGALAALSVLAATVAARL